MNNDEDDDDDNYDDDDLEVFFFFLPNKECLNCYLIHFFLQIIIDYALGN